MRDAYLCSNRSSRSLSWTYEENVGLAHHAVGCTHDRNRRYIFVDGLAHNNSLLWIGIGGNNVGPEGAGYIATGISTNDSLQWLALGGNDIGDAGALKIAAVLKDDGCILQSIGLGGNNISDVGISHVTKALWSNSYIESLGLGGNAIGMYCIALHC